MVNYPNVPSSTTTITDATNTAVQLKLTGVGDSVTTGFIAAQMMLFNGGSSDRMRTPQTFVTIAAIAITAGTPVAVWTPPGGRKFHLMGFCVSSSVAASIIFKDGTNEVLRVPVLAGAPVQSPNGFGNGYASTTANNPLYMDVTVSGSVSGFVFGTAEF